MSYFAIYYDTWNKYDRKYALDTSVRTSSKLTDDIITDVSKAERIFYRYPDITHQCPKHRSSTLKRQMSWTLRCNAQDIDNQCTDIVDQWTVFSFYLGICQQCPDIDSQDAQYTIAPRKRRIFLEGIIFSFYPNESLGFSEEIKFLVA